MMSRIRIVKGEYTKITGGDHRMFSEGNIISSAGKKYQKKGNDGGILFDDPKAYEPWKSKERYDWYHGLFGHTVNMRIPITDLDLNIEVKTCLTAISSVIRFEAYDLDSSEQYKYHNWVYVLTVYMNNRGELVEGGMDLFTYKAERKVGSAERNVEKKKDSEEIIFKKTRYELKSKGKDLHDEVFLDHKLIFSNGMERAINFDSKTQETPRFYDLLGFFLKKASYFNRIADLSFVYACTSNAKDFLDEVNETSDQIAFVTDARFVGDIFDKFGGTALFKEVFGVVSYITGTYSDIKDLLGLKNMRGPIQITDILCARMNEQKNFTKFPSSEHYLLTNEFEALGKKLLNNVEIEDYG